MSTLEFMQAKSALNERLSKSIADGSGKNSVIARLEGAMAKLHESAKGQFEDTDGLIQRVKDTLRDMEGYAGELEPSRLSDYRNLYEKVMAAISKLSGLLREANEMLEAVTFVVKKGAEAKKSADNHMRYPLRRCLQGVARFPLLKHRVTCETKPR